MKLTHAAALGAAATLALATPAIGAALPTSITVGGDGSAGVHPFTAASTGAVSIAAERANDFLSMSCSSASVPATPESTVSSGPAVSGLLAIRKLNLTGCTAPFGTYTVVTQGAWSFERTGGSPTTGRSDVLPGRLVDVAFTIGNAGCRFDVTGRAAARFDEGTQTLHVNETGERARGLTMSNIWACGGQYVEGGRFTLRVSLKTTSPVGLVDAVP